METPRYLLHEPLASGGMGVVHLGTLVSPAGERRVAIKLLAERGRLDERARARLIAEARLVFQLTHTNVCQVIDLGENELGTFVVMEFVSGLDLRRLLGALADHGRDLDVPSAVYIGREVARALDYAHRRSDARGLPLGLVHGDVTPQNILLSVEGEVKLADFGIARALGGTAPGVGLRAGTPGYVAPELADRAGDHRVDLFALGVTLLVALSGETPERAPGAIERVRARRPEVTHELAEALKRATAVDPRQRFLAAADLEHALSLELARSWPGFVPSRLAEVVRAYATTAPRRPAAQTGVLQSVIGTAPPTIESVAPRPPATATHTHAHEQPRRWPRLAAAAAALTLAAVALAGWRLRTHERAATTTTNATAPAATTTTPSPSHAPPTNTPASDTPPTNTPPPNAPETNAAPTAARSPVDAPTIEAPPVVVTPSPRPSTRAPKRAAAHPRTTAIAAASDGEPALLTVNATPWGSIYVDGRRVADETPLYRFAVRPGDHVVQVRFGDDAAAARAERVHVAAGETRTLGFRR